MITLLAKVSIRPDLQESDPSIQEINVKKAANLRLVVILCTSLSC